MKKINSSLIVTDSKKSFYQKEFLVLEINSDFFYYIDFHDGMIQIEKDSLIGYLNKNGYEIIECQYENGRNFSDGLACVKKMKNMDILIKMGKKLLSVNMSMDSIFLKDLPW